PPPPLWPTTRAPARPLERKFFFPGQKSAFFSLRRALRARRSENHMFQHQTRPKIHFFKSAILHFHVSDKKNGHFLTNAAENPLFQICHFALSRFWFKKAKKSY